MNARDLGIAVAAAGALLGIAAVFTSAVDLSGVLNTQSRVLLALAGLAWGLLLVERWTGADLGGYRPPERERVAPVSTPGEDVDELFALGARATGETARYYRSRGRDRLQELAVRVLTTHAGCSPEEAHRRLREGTWTEDPAAARFFQLRADAGTAVGGRVGREHPHTRRARRVVAELKRLAEASA